jgi:murein DD-endopeptidase MepM/ murein hydrolase activator NlpD
MLKVGLGREQRRQALREDHSAVLPPRVLVFWVGGLVTIYSNNLGTLTPGQIGLGNSNLVLVDQSTEQLESFTLTQAAKVTYSIGSSSDHPAVTLYDSHFLYQLVGNTSGVLQPGSYYFDIRYGFDNSAGFDFFIFSVTAAAVSLPAPTLTSISPGVLPADNLVHTIHLYGANFQSGDSLTFIDPDGDVYSSVASKLHVISSTQIDYDLNDGGDAGSWFVWVNSPDGTQLSNMESFQAASIGPNHVPVASTIGKTSAPPGSHIALSDLFPTWSDPDSSDHVAQFAVRDRTVGGGYLTIDGVAQPENVVLDAIDISQIGHYEFVVGPSGKTDTIGFQVIDSVGAYSKNVTATVSSIDHAPTVSTVGRTTDLPGTHIALSDLFPGWSDSDSADHVAKFAVRDRTVGGGYLTIDGIRQTDNVLLDAIDIGQIGHYEFVVGPSGKTDTIGFQVIDSYGTYSKNVTATVSSLDHAPIAAAISKTTGLPGTSIALTDLFPTWSDPDSGDHVAKFAVRDRTVGGGYVTIDGVRQADNVLLDGIDIAQIDHYAFVVGPSGKTDTIGFQVIDGYGTYSKNVTATVSSLDHAPIATAVARTSALPGTSIALTDLFPTWSDSDSGDHVAKFAVRDRTVGGGYLTIDGVRQADNMLLDGIDIAQIDHYAFVVGPSGKTDTIGFQVIDSYGTYSKSLTATVSSANHAPIAAAVARTTDLPGTSIALTDLFPTWSDPDSGDHVAKFAVRDRTVGGGYLTIDGVRQADNVLLDGIDIAQIDHYAFVVGPSGKTDTVAFQAIDSFGSYSKAVTATVAAKIVPDQPPQITSNGGGDGASISLREDVTFVTTVAADDPDNTAMKFSIAGGTDRNLFKIDTSSGVLAFKSAPDFEKPKDSGHDNTYNVVVTVSDGKMTDSQSIAVHVTDGPEVHIGAWTKPVALDVFPLAGTPIVTQGYGGDVSHNTNTYSVDFSAAIGTPVQATGHGIVVSIRTDSSGQGDLTEGGYGNFVTVLQDGGFYATYAHFSEVDVAPGDVVNAGDSLGLSGVSGFVDGAHIHVHFGTQLFDDDAPNNDGINDRASSASDSVPPAFFAGFFPADELAGQIDLSNPANITVRDIFGTAGDDGEPGTADAFHGSPAANRMFGGAGNDFLWGQGGKDILVGGSGEDTFVFDKNFAKDTIADFHPGEDRIEIKSTLIKFPDANAVLLHTADDGHGNTVVTYDGADTITLLDVTKSELHPSDFIFV